MGIQLLQVLQLMKNVLQVKASITLHRNGISPQNFATGKYITVAYILCKKQKMYQNANMADFRRACHN